ncbi:hypothetical protein ACFVH6_25570 [Spirillospora sp. NPDC127200]
MSDRFTNDDRAMWAAEALAVFVRRTRTDPESVLSDFIADLLHLCDRIDADGWDFEAAVKNGTWHYTEEVAEEELEERGITSWTLGEAGLLLHKLKQQPRWVATPALPELEAA